MQSRGDSFFNADYRTISQNCFTKNRKNSVYTPPVCIPGGFLLLDGNEFSLLDGNKMSLLSTCPQDQTFSLLDGTVFSLLDGTPLLLL